MQNLTLTESTRRVATRMEHLTFGVSDLEQSISFYRDLFGFEVRYDATYPDGDRTVHIGTDLFYLSLSEIEGPVSSGAFAHFGFTTPDLDAFEAQALKMAVEMPYGRVPRKEGDAVYVVDPSGYSIEVVQYRPDYVYG